MGTVLIPDHGYFIPRHTFCICIRTNNVSLGIVNGIVIGILKIYQSYGTCQCTKMFFGL